MYLNNYQSFIFGAVILGLLSFVACEKTIETNKMVDFGTKAELSQSEEIWFGTDTLTGVKVKLTEIADSRCPEDVQCIWAGEAKVKMLAVSKTDSVNLDLKISPAHSSRTDTLSVLLNSKNYKALLFDVSPYPNTNNDSEKIAIFTIINSN